jgi:excisionase family DNA binding protein
LLLSFWSWGDIAQRGVVAHTNDQCKIPTIEQPNRVTEASEGSSFPKEIAEQLISVTEAAKFSNLTPSYIRRLLRNGELEGVKIGEAWLTTEEALSAYLKKDRRPGPKRA